MSEKLSEEPNLKEIERRSYSSYHQDGLLDIFCGMYILGFGLGIFMFIAWDFIFGIIMPGALIALAVPIWIAAKRRITIPRIGYVNFGIRGTNKLFAIFTGAMVLALGAFSVFTLANSITGSRQWLDLIFQNGMLIIGFGILAVCTLFGYTMGLKRLYAYGLIAAIALVIGHFMGFFFGYILIALGIIMMLTGIALLVGFVQKYPAKGAKPIAD